MPLKNEIRVERMKCATATTTGEVRELLKYEPSTGLFFWKKDVSTKIKAGMQAGSIDRQGYIVIVVRYRNYSAHRLAWLLMTGEWPRQIDHRNNTRNDNRWENLRIATNSQNQMNCRIKSKNWTGQKNVYHNGTSFVVRIMADGVDHNKTFQTIEEAVAHAQALRQRLHGEYARDGLS